MEEELDIYASNPFGQIEKYAAVRDALNIEDPHRKPSNMYGGSRARRRSRYSRPTHRRARRSRRYSRSAHRRAHRSRSISRKH